MTISKIFNSKLLYSFVFIAAPCSGDTVFFVPDGTVHSTCGCDTMGRLLCNPITDPGCYCSDTTYPNSNNVCLNRSQCHRE